ncbi:ATP-dependent DNA helicase pif1-like [Pocillopora verrucosa]|uniref:ATP-dependent DNA helicase pif1-like n=1 Tax=Pocillopora verrucosa TaxID=203993 RepID=UPI00333FC685
MSVRLSHGQAEVVRLACKGHNFLVTGQGGTGKSTVVREIISNLQAAGKKVSVVCSSGIACTVYDPGVASTVHSYYGLGIADLSWEQLVERSTKNRAVIERVKKADVLIWDEASLSSQRMLELVNAIHHRLSEASHFSWRVPPITPSSECL